MGAFYYGIILEQLVAYDKVDSTIEVNITYYNYFLGDENR